MDLTWSAQDEQFRAEARDWLEANVPRQPLPSGDTARGLRRATWSGSGALFDGPLVGRVVARGVRRPRRLALGVADLRGGVLPGRRAAAGHPERHLPARADASSSSARQRAAGRAPAAGWRRREDLWCQGWSEPDAGSDLAGISSRAVRDEAAGGWRLTGQKTWTTRGAFCTHLFGLFRTDPRGASATAASPTSSCRSTPPGVTVRGFDRLDGDEGFAEVFFDDVFVPDDGGRSASVDQGWAVAMATTGSERGLTLRSPGRFLGRSRAAGRRSRASGGEAATDAAAATGSARAWMEAEAYQLYTLAQVTDIVEGRPGRRAVEPQQDLLVRARRRGCTRPRSTCSARTPSSSTARGAAATSSRCRARSTRAPTRSSATSSPSACSACRGSEQACVSLRPTTSAELRGVVRRAAHRRVPAADGTRRSRIGAGRPHWPRAGRSRRGGAARAPRTTAGWAWTRTDLVSVSRRSGTPPPPLPLTATLAVAPALLAAGAPDLLARLVDGGLTVGADPAATGHVAFGPVSTWCCAAASVGRGASRFSTCPTRRPRRRRRWTSRWT